MLDREALKKQLKIDEGVRLKVYRDTKGFFTIGVGHLLGSTPRMTEITMEEAMALLDVDIDEAIASCRRIFDKYDDLSEPRQRAVVNMTFNRGEQRMKDSSTIVPAIRVALDSGKVEDWQKIPDAIKASPWANDVGERAERLGKTLETGLA